MASQPQLNTAQLSKMIENLQKRVDAKTLECSALDRMRRETDSESFTLALALRESIHDYLTAKLNQELVTLEEYEIQLRGWKSALAQMQSGILLPSGVKVGGRG